MFIFISFFFYCNFQIWIIWTWTRWFIFYFNELIIIKIWDFIFWVIDSALACCLTLIVFGIFLTFTREKHAKQWRILFNTIYNTCFKARWTLIFIATIYGKLSLRNFFINFFLKWVYIIYQRIVIFLWQWICLCQRIVH